MYLLDRPPQDALGPDGHQHRGALRIGAEATRRTWQASSAREQLPVGYHQPAWHQRNQASRG